MPARSPEAGDRPLQNRLARCAGGESGREFPRGSPCGSWLRGFRPIHDKGAGIGVVLRLARDPLANGVHPDVCRYAAERVSSSKDVVIEFLLPEGCAGRGLAEEHGRLALEVANKVEAVAGDVAPFY